MNKALLTSILGVIGLGCGEAPLRDAPSPDALPVTIPARTEPGVTGTAVREGAGARTADGSGSKPDAGPDGIEPDAAPASDPLPAADATPPVPPGATTVPSDFAGVVWLHSDVSGWPATATLAEVTVGGGRICLDYDKADQWPGVDHVSAFVNANPWIFVHRDGTWYAATWEWMRHGQTCKNLSSVAGDHIKRPPLLDFQPRSGEWYGLMVSGLARDSVRNVQERTQVLMLQWP